MAASGVDPTSLARGQSPLLNSNFPLPADIAHDVRAHGFRIYPGAIDLTALEEMRRFWTDYFRRARPRRRVIRGEFRLGEENFIGYSDDKQQCMFRAVDFLWNAPMHLLTRRLGEHIHQIRNRAQGFEPELGFSYRFDCYGLYVSTTCYPTRAGWMRRHSDGHNDVPILQYMVPMTHKGVDYEAGGLYLVLDDGTKVDVDAQMKPGSVVFFDGRLDHGVDTIGDAGVSIGRIASFAITTFFRIRRDLPDLMRRAEDKYWAIERRIARLRGKGTRNEY
jgi:hypothetical protein